MTNIKENEILDELWTLPWNSYQVADLDGMPIYTSDGLKKSFFEMIKKDNKISKVSEIFFKFIKKGTIVPCWLNKGIISLSIFKVFAPKSSKSVMGFYYPLSNQIYLLMDNNISFGFANDKILIDLLLHESMHLAAANLKNEFSKVFTKELTKYYSSLFSSFFKINSNIDSEVKVFYEFLFRYFEYEISTSKNFTEDYNEILFKLFSNKSSLSKIEFNNSVLELLNFISLYFNDFNKLLSNITSFKKIYLSMLYGYKIGLGVTNDMSICIQELFFPSEVIAMYIELQNDISKAKLVLNKF